MTFQLDVVSLTGSIFSGPALEVTLPGISGELTVLPRHMPVVVPLTMGEVAVRLPDRSLSFSIGKGVFSFDGKIGLLLMEDVASADEISEDRVIQARKKAEDLLAKGLSEEEKTQVVYQLRKSLIDLKIARKRKKKL